MAAPTPTQIERRVLPAYHALVLDMDGVVTDTARVHAAAWKALFDEVLRRIGPRDQPPFRPGARLPGIYRRAHAGRRHAQMAGEFGDGVW
jgi:beta-phosphoglucomutase-like phosphatase (HAD superfamily)